MSTIPSDRTESLCVQTQEILHDCALAEQGNGSADPLSTIRRCLRTLQLAERSAGTSCLVDSNDQQHASHGWERVDGGA
jgi:hypothetical protein